MSKSNGATIQKSKAGRVLPLEIIEHDGVRHDLAEAGHRVKLSDDLCTQTERNRESGRLYTSGEEAGHDTSGGRGARAVPLTGDVGALPAAARAATGRLRRLEVAGFADREVNLTA